MISADEAEARGLACCRATIIAVMLSSLLAIAAIVWWRLRG